MNMPSTPINQTIKALYFHKKIARNQTVNNTSKRNILLC